jgi:hypothetical protein
MSKELSIQELENELERLQQSPAQNWLGKWAKSIKISNLKKKIEVLRTFDDINVDGDWTLINRDEYPDYLLIRREDVVDLVEGSREKLDSGIELIEAFQKWMEEHNILK